MAVKLAAQLRTKTGKGPARQLRRDGRVPGVVYGAATEPQSVSVDGATLARVEQEAGLHSLIDLQVEGGEGESHRVLIKELVRDPVRGDLLHVDFHAVALDQEMQTVVEVVLEGEESRSDDGVVAVVLRELNIACLPTAIPESLPVDVSELVIGDVVTVGDIVPPEGVRLLNDAEEAVVTVTAPQAEPEPEADDAAEEGEAEAGESADEE